MPKVDDQTFSDMSRATKATARPVQRTGKLRQSSEDRAQEIVRAAADHFAEVGFGGSTREIARRVGVTQPLLYRYFPTKDSLIEAGYTTVYLDCWNPDWDSDLTDRTVAVRDRFDRFYADYTKTIFTPTWLRIFYFAGLRDAKINEWYNHVVEELVLKRLVREHRVELGLPDETFVSPEELGPVWLMHGGLLQYGLRKHVFGFRVMQDTDLVIADSLDMYFAIAEKSYRRAGEIRTPENA